MINSSLNEPFDPNKTTVKDYLVYLVDKSEKLELNQKAMEDRLINLEKDLDRRTALFEEREKRRNYNLVAVGTLFSLLGAIIASLLEVFTRKS